MDERPDEDGEGKGDVKPESLMGRKDDASREGEQVSGQLSPDVAGQILDGISVDSSRRLSMSDKQGVPAKDKNGRNG